MSVSPANSASTNAKSKQKYKRKLNRQGSTGIVPVMERTMSVRFALIPLLFTCGVQAQRADRPLPATCPSTTQATTQPAFEISIECDTPELQEWADSLRPIVEKWYP